MGYIRVSASAATIWDDIPAFKLAAAADENIEENLLLPPFGFKQKFMVDVEDFDQLGFRVQISFDIKSRIRHLGHHPRRTRSNE